MSFTLILIFTIIFLIAGVGIRNSYSQPSDKKVVTSQSINKSSRSEINELLSNIEKKNAPEKKMGAMCYEVAARPEYLEYVCPIDGEKTVYGRKITKIDPILTSIVEMRRQVQRINNETNLVAVELDERKLCHNCSPGIKDEKRFVSLVEKFPDGRKYVYENITADGLRILVGFFEKKLSYKSFNDSEMPLKDEVGKIKKILGLNE